MQQAICSVSLPVLANSRHNTFNPAEKDVIQSEARRFTTLFVACVYRDSSFLNQVSLLATAAQLLAATSIAEDYNPLRRNSWPFEKYDNRNFIYF